MEYRQLSPWGTITAEAASPGGRKRLLGEPAFPLPTFPFPQDQSDARYRYRDLGWRAWFTT